MPIGPFRNWLQAEYVKLQEDETVQSPSEELAFRVGSVERVVYRWRNGLDGDGKPTRLIRFLVVVEALHHADELFELMYPKWCPSCGAKKNGDARLCWRCYTEAGGHTGRRTSKRPENMTEETIARARELYEGGLSYRAVAKRLFPETRYASENAMSNQLCAIARRDEWKRRTKAQATTLANRRRGRKVPRCRFIKANGERCKHGASMGYCWHHRPESLVTGLSQLRKDRAQGLEVVRRIAERQSSREAA